MSFLLKGTDGTFVYSWTNDDSAGDVTGPGIPTSVSCSSAPRPTPSTRCERTDYLDRKMEVPDRRVVVDECQEWASRSWG